MTEQEWEAVEKWGNWTVVTIAAVTLALLLVGIIR